MTRYESLMRKAEILRDAAYRVSDDRLRLAYRRKQAALINEARRLPICVGTSRAQ